MHNSILLALWGGLAYALFRFINYVREEARHRRNAKRLGCEPPYRTGNKWDVLGLHNAYTFAGELTKMSYVPFYKARMDDVCRKEGRNITTISQTVAGSEMVVTTEPKNVQAVLATKFKDFGLGQFRFNMFSPLLGSGIFATDGEQWSHARAMLRPQFARDQVSDIDLEERHMQHMFRHLTVQSDGWTPVTDIQPLFFRLTLDSATEFLFGESVNSQQTSLPGYVPENTDNPIPESDFAYAFENSKRAIAEAFAFGQTFYWLRYGKEFRRHVKICHDFIDHFVRGALANEKPSATGMTSSGKKKFVFLNAVAESTRDPVELRDHMLNILLAGRDTTASSLSFLFIELSRHPEIYAKLRAIILENFGTYRNPRDITFESLKACSYLQWTLQEGLRLYPVVPNDLRMCLKDTTLPTGGGPDGTKPVYVRKGTSVEYPLYGMHRREDFWGADANEFRPDRWDGKRTGWEYLPFNGGPRVCIGQQFALTEAGYVVVRLLQRFEACEGVGNSWDPVEKGGYGFVRWSLTLTGAPADGVKVQFKEATDL